MCENKYLKIGYIIEKYFFRVVFTFALQIQEKWQTNSSTPQAIQKNHIIKSMLLYSPLLNFLSLFSVHYTE